jgi:hypothetical protein
MKDNIQAFKSASEAIAALRSLKQESTAVAQRITVSFVKSLKPSELDAVLKASPRRWRTWIKFAYKNGAPTDVRSARTLYNEALAARKDAAKKDANAAKPIASTPSSDKPIDAKQSNANSTPSDPIAEPIDAAKSSDAPSTIAEPKQSNNSDAQLVADLTSANTAQGLAIALQSLAFSDNLSEILRLLPQKALDKLSVAIAYEKFARNKQQEEQAKEKSAKRREAAKKAKQETPDTPPDATPTDNPPAEPTE